MRLRLRGVVAALIAAAVIPTWWVAVSTGPAAGRTQDVVTLRSGTDVDVDYPALIGNFSTAGAANPEPSDCTDPVPYCDTLPIDIVPPSGVSPADDWYVTLSLSWTPNETDPAAGNQLDDVDIFTYDDGQTLKAAGDEGYTDVGDANDSTNNPEIVKLYKPRLGRYNLVVDNATGVNQGYHLKAHMTISKFEQPFEALAPAASPPPSTGGTASTGQPTVATPPVTTAGGEIAPSLAAPAATLPDVAVTRDASLSAPPASTFDSDIAAPDRPVAGALAAAADRPIGKASTPLLLATLVLLPLALLGALMTLVSRRRRLLFA